LSSTAAGLTLQCLPQASIQYKKSGNDFESSLIKAIHEGQDGKLNGDNLDIYVRTNDIRMTNQTIFCIRLDSLSNYREWLRNKYISEKRTSKKTSFWTGHQVVPTW